VPRVCRRAESGSGGDETLYDEHAAVLWRYAMQFTVARNMIIDERRSGRFHVVVSSLDDSHTLEQPTGEQVNATVGGDAMTVPRTMRAPIDPESRLAQGDWRDTKTTLRPIRAGVVPIYVTMHSVDGL
jgi:hypothetical protein